MKKIVFTLAAVAAFSFASCGGNKTEKGGVNDSDSTTVVADATNDPVAAAAQGVTEQLKASVNDPEKLQAAVTAVQATLQQYLVDGNKEAVVKYAQLVQNYINGNAAVKEALTKAKVSLSEDAAAAKADVATNLFETLNGMVNVAKTSDGAMEKVTKAATEQVQEAASAAADKAVDATKEAAKNKAKEEMKKGAEKAEKAMKESADKAKEKTSEEVNKGLKKFGL
ncbi:hypothetical protein [Alloprevotella rava]|uniref:Archaellum component FlaG (FlaF/FlaG flagellin family) n=1 Tax=Alloprevotella rava TaxID=671218 RepID=A0A7W5YFH7_9BACT|nr:hypothetical protein [Alloprevotella rava]MBB3702176.1 archaellum component FlaG (FlaF/FlaG flagellin family) [Alloprevotella rava]